MTISRTAPAEAGTPDSTQVPHTHWRWAPHVRVREVDEQLVLLDLRRSRYLGIGGRSRPALMAALEGRPDVNATTSPAVLRPLVQQGLLIAGGAAPTRLASLPLAERSIEGHEAVAAPRTGPAELWCFLRAITSAGLRLRWRSLHSIANAVSARRERCGRRDPAPGTTQGQQLHRLRELVAGFEGLRPLVFTARDQCLFDSLALIELLAIQGHHPHWVLGVRTHPFRAHAWVQLGNLVLNDHHEHVRRFQPILVA